MMKGCKARIFLEIRAFCMHAGGVWWIERSRLDDKMQKEVDKMPKVLDKAQNVRDRVVL